MRNAAPSPAIAPPGPSWPLGCWCAATATGEEGNCGQCGWLRRPGGPSDRVLRRNLVLPQFQPPSGPPPTESRTFAYVTQRHYGAQLQDGASAGAQHHALLPAGARGLGGPAEVRFAPAGAGQQGEPAAMAWRPRLHVCFERVLHLVAPGPLDAGLLGARPLLHLQSGTNRSKPRGGGDQRVGRAGPGAPSCPDMQGSGMHCCGSGCAAVQGPSSCTTAACGEAGTSNNLRKAASTCKALQCPGHLAGAAAPAGSLCTHSSCVARLFPPLLAPASWLCGPGCCAGTPLAAGPPLVPHCAGPHAACLCLLWGCRSGVMRRVSGQAACVPHRGRLPATSGRSIQTSRPCLVAAVDAAQSGAAAAGSIPQLCGNVSGQVTQERKAAQVVDVHMKTAAVQRRRHSRYSASSPGCLPRCTTVSTASCGLSRWKCGRICSTNSLQTSAGVGHGGVQRRAAAAAAAGGEEGRRAPAARAVLHRGRSPP